MILPAAFYILFSSIFYQHIQFVDASGQGLYYGYQRALPDGDRYIIITHREGGPIAPNKKWFAECGPGELLTGLGDAGQDFSGLIRVWCGKLFDVPVGVPSPYRNGYADTNYGTPNKKDNTYDDNSYGGAYNRKAYHIDEDDFYYPYFPHCHVLNITTAPYRHCYRNDTYEMQRLTINSAMVAIRDDDENFAPSLLRPWKQIQGTAYKCCTLPPSYYLDHLQCVTVWLHDPYREYFDDINLNRKCPSGYAMTGLSPQLDPWTQDLSYTHFECCAVIKTGLGIPPPFIPPVPAPGPFQPSFFNPSAPLAAYQANPNVQQRFIDDVEKKRAAAAAQAAAAAARKAAAAAKTPNALLNAMLNALTGSAPGVSAPAAALLQMLATASGSPIAIAVPNSPNNNAAVGAPTGAQQTIIAALPPGTSSTSQLIAAGLPIAASVPQSPTSSGGGTLQPVATLPNGINTLNKISDSLLANAAGVQNPSQSQLLQQILAGAPQTRSIPPAASPSADISNAPSAFAASSPATTLAGGSNTLPVSQQPNAMSALNKISDAILANAAAPNPQSSQLLQQLLTATTQQNNLTSTEQNNLASPSISSTRLSGPTIQPASLPPGAIPLVDFMTAPLETTANNSSNELQQAQQMMMLKLFAQLLQAQPQSSPSDATAAVQPTQQQPQQQIPVILSTNNSASSPGTFSGMALNNINGTTTTNISSILPTASGVQTSSSTLSQVSSATNTLQNNPGNSVVQAGSVVSGAAGQQVAPAVATAAGGQRPTSRLGYAQLETSDNNSNGIDMSKIDPYFTAAEIPSASSQLMHPSELLSSNDFTSPSLKQVPAPALLTYSSFPAAPPQSSSSVTATNETQPVFASRPWVSNDNSSFFAPPRRVLATASQTNADSSAISNGGLSISILRPSTTWTGNNFAPSTNSKQNQESSGNTNTYGISANDGNKYPASYLAYKNNLLRRYGNKIYGTNSASSLRKRVGSNSEPFITRSKKYNNAIITYDVAMPAGRSQLQTPRPVERFKSETTSGIADKNLYTAADVANFLRSFKEQSSQSAPRKISNPSVSKSIAGSPASFSTSHN